MCSTLASLCTLSSPLRLPVSVFLLMHPPPPPLPLPRCLLLPSCFSCLLNRDVLIWGLLAQATRERVSGAFDQLQDQTCPPLPRAHSSDWSCSIMGRHRQPKMHTHACSLCRSYKHEHTQMQTHTHTHNAGGLRSVCWHDTVGWLVCWTRGSGRAREMACVISPSLPFFFASDSKMDDCNHRNHQWDKMEVYGAARHSHGNPPVRLLRRTAMGTPRCLFVWGFCCFICIFLFSSIAANMKASSWKGKNSADCVKGT